MSFSLSGIASGLDTANIISGLMDIERIPYKSIQAKQTFNDEKINAYRAINTKATAVRTAIQDLVLKGTWATQGVKVNEKFADTADFKLKEGAKIENGIYKLNVKTIAVSSSFVSNSVGDLSASAQHLNGETLTINKGDKSHTITIQDAATMKDVFDQITSGVTSSGMGLNAYSLKTTETNTSLILSSNATGVDNEITLNSTDSENKRALEISAGLKAALGLKEAQKATNAEFTYNGLSISRSSNTFDDLIQGVNITLKTTGEFEAKVEKDTEKLNSVLDKFVTAFSDLTKTIHGLVKKDGALQGDSMLKNLHSELTGSMNYTFKNKDTNVQHHITWFGFETDKRYSSASNMTGELTIDKDKLYKMIEEDSENTLNVLTGYFTSLSDKVHEYTKTTGIIASAITGLTDLNKMHSDRLNSMDLSLQMKEARLKAQFNTMETMLNSLNNEQSWLKSQFDSLTKANS